MLTFIAVASVTAVVGLVLWLLQRDRTTPLRFDWRRELKFELTWLPVRGGLVLLAAAGVWLYRYLW